MSGKWILVFGEMILRFLKRNWGILCVSIACELVAAFCAFTEPR